MTFQVLISSFSNIRSWPKAAGQEPLWEAVAEEGSGKTGPTPVLKNREDKRHPRSLRQPLQW